MENEEFVQLGQLKSMRAELTRFMMAYKFACDEINTKVNILSDEFNYLHDYNPIEHVKSRVKSPESILNKIRRKGYGFTLPAIRENIKDIAGVRITCSFISDIYLIAEMLGKQEDIEVVEIKDYIKNPKPNGYQSLHMILQIPIFMTDRTEHTYVEIQIRTIAMDFWASLEHKIYYKYDKNIPAHLAEELRNSAEVAAELDRKMEWLHKEVSKIKREDESAELLPGFGNDEIKSLIGKALHGIEKRLDMPSQEKGPHE